MEAHANPWNRCAVVVDHGKTEADGEKEAREVVEMERVLASRCGKRRLDAVPSDEDRGERAEKVLPHGVEEAEILREQVVDRLKDELEKIRLHGLGSSKGVSYGMRKFCSELVM